VEKFKRCVALLRHGFDATTTAFLARLSIPLVEQFRQLQQSLKPASHRQRELEEFLKKSPPEPPHSPGRPS